MNDGLSWLPPDGVQYGVKTKICPKCYYHKMAWRLVYSKSLLKIWSAHRSLQPESSIHCLRISEEWFDEVLKMKIKWVCHSVPAVKRVRPDCRSPSGSLKIEKVGSISFVVWQIELGLRSAFFAGHMSFSRMGSRALSPATEQVNRKCFCWFVIAKSNLFCSK